MSVTLFGKRVFVDIIKDTEMMFEWALNSMTSDLKTEKQEWGEGGAETHRGEGNVKVEKESEVMWPQAKITKECQHSPESLRGKEWLLL